MNIKINTIKAIALGAIAVGSAQQVPAQLVQNGSFEVNGGAGQVGFNTSAANWSVPAPSASYTFLYSPGLADTGGANGEYGAVGLWGPGNGVANGLPATSPDGGYYLGADPDFQNSAPGLTQTISGLTVGQNYALSFFWAGAQQSGFLGPTSEGWQVSLGADTQNVGNLAIPSHGFTGWQYSTLDYTATSSSEVLSFLATGTGGGGEPPFSLLDGVSLTTTVPDSASTAVLVGLGTSALGLAARLRRQRRQ